MKPIAAALDRLQGEENMYLGSLVPCVRGLSWFLEKKSQDKSAVPNLYWLAAKLHQAVDRRFGPVNCSDPHLIAAALHPGYRLLWVNDLNEKTRITALIVKAREELRIKQKENEGGDASVEESSDADEDDFMSAFQSRPAAVLSSTGSRSGRSRGRLTVTNVSEPIVIGFLSCGGERMNAKISVEKISAALHDPLLRRLFVQYNTTLPSSAAVERLFSTAGDVLKPKRANMSNVNFDRAMFLRQNMWSMWFDSPVLKKRTGKAAAKSKM